MRSSLVRSLLFAALAGALPLSAAHADDVLGVYFGGSIGQSQLNIDSLDFAGHDTAWKATFGVRAIDLFGGEIEYANLGSPHKALGGYGDVRTTASGPAVFGMAYLPLPVPFLDLYAKAGLANIQQRAEVALAPGFNTCAQGISCGGFSTTESEFAWGAGAQLKSGSIAVRAEFEQFRATGGNLNLASIGLYWTFL
jgi:opacity protein-like surface antigen